MTADSVQAAFDEALATRMPGESLMMVPTLAVAEAYLASLHDREVTVIREEFPNDMGLYARLKYPHRIPEDKIFVQSPDN